MADNPALFKIDGVPFVPATDLRQKRDASLSDDEICAIGLSLFLSAPDTQIDPTRNEKWRVYSRARAVDRRVLARRN